MMAGEHDSACSWCGGRGWKYVRARRSVENICPPSESTAAGIRRTVCLGCLGSGTAELSAAA
jgi:hypothetical protein